MTDLRKAADPYIRPGTVVPVDIETTKILVDLLRQALAQPEQKPYAWMTTESEWRLANGGNCKGAVPVHGKRSRISTIPLYTAPPKREWVGLTDDEIAECKIDGGLPHAVNWRLSAKVLQAKLKEKNT